MKPHTVTMSTFPLSLLELVIFLLLAVVVPALPGILLNATVSITGRSANDTISDASLTWTDVAKSLTARTLRPSAQYGLGINRSKTRLLLVALQALRAFLNPGIRHPEGPTSVR